MRRTVFHIPKMDCPAEERLVRLALEGKHGIEALSFDLSARTLTARHEGEPATIEAALRPLGLGARHVESRPAAADVETPGDQARPAPPGDAAGETRTLRVLLAINAVMFVVELGAGWIAESTSLIADSLDMLADAAVYGVSLFAVSRSSVAQLRAAHLSGALQLILALGALAEIARRVVLGSEPGPPVMMGVALLALVANAFCLGLIVRHRHGGAHMKASYIFSANDVIANVGVIVAGALVGWTGSRVPDLVVGSAIALVVLGGAVRILHLR